MNEQKTQGKRRFLHVSTSVEGLLSLSDVGLKAMMPYIHYDGEQLQDVSELRAMLTQAYLEGQKFIPSEGCDNFDPEIGCLGHCEE